MLASILTALGVLLLLWVLYNGIKNNPEAFSKSNLTRSFLTAGLIALVLIGLVALAVMALR